MMRPSRDVGIKRVSSGSLQVASMSRPNIGMPWSWTGVESSEFGREEQIVLFGLVFRGE